MCETWCRHITHLLTLPYELSNRSFSCLSLNAQPRTVISRWLVRRLNSEREREKIMEFFIVFHDQIMVKMRDWNFFNWAIHQIRFLLHMCIASTVDYLEILDVGDGKWGKHGFLSDYYFFTCGRYFKCIMTWQKLKKKKWKFPDYSHCSFRYGHVKIVEDLIGLWFWSVGFESMPYRDCVLLSTPLRPSIVYRRDRRIASPEKR